MKLLNRAAIGLTPLQPYADWVASLPVDVTELDTAPTLFEHQAESRVYLLDECEGDNPAVVLDNTVAEHYWQSLFINELSAWDEFGNYWPEQSLALFQQWFQVSPFPLVFDVAEEPLLSAALS